MHWRRSSARERVLGCLANTSGELLPSGEVLFTRNVNIYVGELPAGSSARAERIARTIDASGVRTTAVPDVLAREWTKFVGWAGADADVDHDARGDLALPDRSRLRARAGAAGARSRRHRQGGRRAR